MSINYESILAYKRKNLTFEDFLVNLSKSETPIIDCNWDLFTNIAYGTPEPKTMDNSLSNLAKFALELLKNQKGGSNNYNQKGGFRFLQFLMLMFMLFYMATAQVDKREQRLQKCQDIRNKGIGWFSESEENKEEYQKCTIAAESEYQLWLREKNAAINAQENSNQAVKDLNFELTRIYGRLVDQHDATVAAQNSATFYKMFSVGCATALACAIGFMVMYTTHARTKEQLRQALQDNESLVNIIRQGQGQEQLQIEEPPEEPRRLPRRRQIENVVPVQEPAVVGQDINTLVQQIAANQNVAAAANQISQLMQQNPNTALNNITPENLAILLDLEQFVRFINSPPFNDLRQALRSHFSNVRNINVLTGGNRKKQKKTRKRTKKYRK